MINWSHAIAAAAVVIACAAGTLLVAVGLVFVANLMATLAVTLRYAGAS